MIWRVIIIMALIGMWVGSEMHSAEITRVQLDNVTTKVTYDTLNSTKEIKNLGDDANNTFFVRAAGKYVDFIAFVGIEGMMEAIKYGYDHPEYNFNLAWRLLFLTIFAWLIIPVIQILLFIGYGIYAIYIWIKPLWIKYCMKKDFTN